MFRLVGVASLFGVVAGLHFGQDFLVPLALSVLFTFILLPPVCLLQRAGLPRILSVVVTVVLAFGILGAMGYFVVGQVAGLAEKLPEYKENIQSKVKSLNAPFSRSLGKVQGAFDGMTPGPERPPGADSQTSTEGRKPMQVEVVERRSDSFKLVTGLLGPLVSLAGSSAVVILLVIFLLIYQNEIRDRLIRLAGGDDRVTLATQTLGDAVHGISRFLFLQAIVNITYGLAFGIGLFALGVPNALLWGFTAALFRFIPYLGPIVSGVLPVILSLAVFPGWGRPVLVASFIVALEVVSNNVIEPWVYGKRTGLSPFSVVLAAIFWAWLWGPMGLLLSVPLTVCLVTLGKYVPGLSFLAVTLGDEPAFGPELQIYNRLLMGNTAEAAEVIEKESEGKPLSQVYDGLLIPVLRLADEARLMGRLDPERMESLLASIAEIQDDLADAARVKLEKENPPEPNGVSVLCFPASDKADESAGRLLAQALALDGFRAESVALEMMMAEKLDLVVKGKADIVVLSVLPPSTLTTGRYLYKRLRRRLPALPIVIGVWGQQGDLKELESQLAPDGQAVFASTLTQAVKAIRDVARTLAERQRQDMESHPISAAF